MKNNTKLVIFLFICTISHLLPADDLIHVLQKGETLYSISRKYKVSADSIMSFNNIVNPDKLYAGQKIKIPDTYTVKKGDTLYGIAKTLSVPVSVLLTANSLQKDSMLKVGQILVIPRSDDTEKSSTPSEIQTAPAETILSSKPMDDPRTYETKKIDSTVIWPVSVVELSYLAGKIYGVSITAKKGEMVKTISSGTVLSAGPYRGFGQVVFVQSKTGYIYVYGGLDGISSRPGQQLSFGEQIGTLGADSLSGKPQLYFMVYNKDVPVDPAKAPRGF